MKKKTTFHLSVFITVILLLLQGSSLYAENERVIFDESDFNFDEALLQSKFESLNKLELFLGENEGVTFSDLEKKGSILVAGLDNAVAPMGAADGQDGPPLGIPSFLWGCLLGFVGLLIVYLVTDSKSETTKALWGCVALGAAYTVFYLVYAVILGLSYYTL